MQHSIWKLSLILSAASLQAGCFALPHKHNLPPAKMLMEPGPGVGGPGPGVLAGMPVGEIRSSALAPRRSISSDPKATQVNWETGMGGGFDSEPLIVARPAELSAGRDLPPEAHQHSWPPRRGALSDARNRAGQSAHRSVPGAQPDPGPIHRRRPRPGRVGNFVTKVIYLPDPEFQELALAGVETLVSTRLDPGVDPIVEADRRGSILAIVRLGNIDLEVPAANGIVEGGIIQQAGYMAPPGTMVQAGFPGHLGGAYPAGPSHLGGPAPMAMGPISGVSVAEYGMPYVGTPIGLPGPPHVPLGVPAGLQKHQIVNRTKVHLPNPVEKVKMVVKQSPGMSYPSRRTTCTSTSIATPRA